MTEKAEDPRQPINYRKDKMTVINILKTTIVLLLVISAKVNAKETKTNTKIELEKRMKIIESVSGRLFSDVYKNGTFRTGNNLWDNILNQCSVTPSMSCLQKNVYSYLDEKFDVKGDVDIGGGVCFKKNNVDVNKFTKEANVIYLTGSKDDDKERYLDEDNEIEDDEPGKIILILTKGSLSKAN